MTKFAISRNLSELYDGKRNGNTAPKWRVERVSLTARKPWNEFPALQG